MKKLFDKLLIITQKLVIPFRRKKRIRRPFVLEPVEYVTLFILSTHLDWSLRDIEFYSTLLTGKHVDHSTFGKIFPLIPVEYLEEFNRRVNDLIKGFPDSESVLIVDSTGVELDRV